jgi:hypothetical protein
MAESSATSLFGAWFANSALTQVIEGKKQRGLRFDPRKVRRDGGRPAAGEGGPRALQLELKLIF